MLLKHLFVGGCPKRKLLPVRNGSCSWPAALKFFSSLREFEAQHAGLLTRKGRQRWLPTTFWFQHGNQPPVYCTAVIACFAALRSGHQPCLEQQEEFFSNTAIVTSVRNLEALELLWETPSSVFHTPWGCLR
ncbi:hypothetical protein VTI74DRAFT_2428 [Chaetomium olivicolor]